MSAEISLVEVEAPAELAACTCRPSAYFIATNIVFIAHARSCPCFGRHPRIVDRPRPLPRRRRKSRRRSR